MPYSSRRSKVYVGTACDQCFRVKARCAGERPECSRCKSKGTACTYSAGRRKRRSTMTLEKTRSSDSLPYSSSSPCTSPLDAEDDVAISKSDLLGYKPIVPAKTLSYQQSGAGVSSGGVAKFGVPLMTDALHNDFPTSSRYEDTPPPSATSTTLDVSLFPCEGIGLSTFDTVDTYHNTNWTFNKEQNVPLSVFPSQEPALGASSSLHPQDTVETGIRALNLSLTSLRAYMFGMDYVSSEEMLPQLQDSLSIISYHLSSIEASENDRSSGSDSETGVAAGGLRRPLSAVMIMAYSYALQEILSWYLRIWAEKAPAPSKATGVGYPSWSHNIGNAAEPQSAAADNSGQGYSSALIEGIEDYAVASTTYDRYLQHVIAHDIRMCQKLAQQLVAYCRRLMPQHLSQPDSDVSMALDIIVGSLESYGSILL